MVCPKHKNAYFYHNQKLFQQTKRRCASVLVCPTITKPMLLLQTNEISADQITNCNQFGLPNGATHSPGGPEPSHIFGGGIWLAKRTLKRSDRVSVQAISEAKYISALQQNIKLVQASLPLNRELQFKGKPQGLTVTRFSSRYTHPVFLRHSNKQISAGALTYSWRRNMAR